MSLRINEPHLSIRLFFSPIPDLIRCCYTLFSLWGRHKRNDIKVGSPANDVEKTRGRCSEGVQWPRQGCSVHKAERHPPPGVGGDRQTRASECASACVGGGQAGVEERFQKRRSVKTQGGKEKIKWHAGCQDGDGICFPWCGPGRAAPAPASFCPSEPREPTL